MKYIKKPSKLLLRYLLSYLLILFIPIIIMTFFVRNNFINILKEEVLSNNVNTLNRATYVLDNEFSQLQKTSYQMYLNQRLRPFNFAENPNEAIIAKRELLNYAVGNPFVNDIFLYYHGDNYIYSSTSSYSIPNFINNDYIYSGWEENDFYKYINTINVPTVRVAKDSNIPSSSKDKYITLSFPLSNYGVNSYGTVMFLIKESSLKELLKNNLNKYPGNSIIMKDDQILTSLHDTEYLHSKELVNLISSQKSQSSETVILDGQKFLLSYVKSEETGWKYITLIALDDLMLTVSATNSAFYYGLVLILLLGSIVIYCTMCINYSPINKLKIYTEKFWPVNQKDLNEIETVRQTIDFLSSQNSTLNVKIKDSKIAEKEFLLFKLIKGKICSIEKFNEKGKDLGILYTNPFYVCVILDIRCEDVLEDDNRLDLIDDLENNLPDGFEGYATEPIEENKIILILAIDENNISNLQNRLLDIHHNLRHKFGLLLTMGVGNPYNDIARIPNSYMEASTAIDYRLIKGTNRVIFFNEILTDQSSFNSYPHKYFDELEISINQGNIEQIESSLNKIINYIKLHNTPVYIARGICFEIINIVNRKYTLEKKEYPDVFTLTHFETVEDFANIVRKVCSDMFEYIKENNVKENANLITKIISYVNNNYTDCDFSIQETANTFKMALPNLSQYFKEQTGENILDYVTSLRMEKAKQLLLTSDTPLKNIAVSVGYYNVSSFIRRFKQLVGCTPGNYRELHKLT